VGWSHRQRIYPPARRRGAAPRGRGGQLFTVCWAESGAVGTMPLASSYKLMLHEREADRGISYHGPSEL
jgi:hypothetical protein